MSGFIDEYLPEAILGFEFVSSPRWSTTMTQVASGSERRNQNWRHPLFRYTSPEGVRCWEDIAALQEMWMAMAGPAYTFPFRDPLDFASRRLAAPNVEPTVGPTDAVLGVADGLETQFQLVKRYTFGTRTYDRLISHPVVSSVVVALNALPPETPYPALEGGPYTWEVDRDTGLVTFDPAPSATLVITAGFLFDVEVRFEDDDVFDQIVKSYQVGGFADLSFVEVRPCTD